MRRSSWDADVADETKVVPHKAGMSRLHMFAADTSQLCKLHGVRSWLALLVRSDGTWLVPYAHLDAGQLGGRHLLEGPHGKQVVVRPRQVRRRHQRQPAHVARRRQLQHPRLQTRDSRQMRAACEIVVPGSL